MMLLGEFGATALLWLGFSMLLASVVRAMTGWAFSIVAVPMLCLVFPPQQAVVVNILLALAATIKNVPAMRGNISGRIFALLFSGLVGTPAGYWLHKVIDDASLRITIGVLVLGLSAAMYLVQPRARTLTTGALAIAGFASGVLGGAIGIAGPPVVLLFVLTATDMTKVRATLALGLLSVCLVAAVAYMLGGDITQSVMLLFAIALPIVLIGDTMGNRLFARYGGNASRRMSIALSCLVGVLSIWRGLAAA